MPQEQTSQATLDPEAAIAFGKPKGVPSLEMKQASPPREPKLASGLDPEAAAAFGKPSSDSRLDPEAAAAFGSPKASKPEPKRPNTLGGFLTSSLIKTATGKGFSDIYDWAVDKFPSVKKSYLADLSQELARAGPEVLDAASSPAGLALIGAHIYAPTRGLAAGVDTVLSLAQGAKSIASGKAAYDDPNPANVAAFVKDLLYTYGIVKAGSKTGDKLPKLDDVHAKAIGAVDKLEELAPKKGDKKPVRLSKKQERDAIWGDITNPSSRSERLRQKIYRSHPLVANVASMVGVKMPTVLAVGQELVNRRNNLVNLEMHRAKRMVDELKRNTTLEERDVQKLGYVMQGDATADEVGLSDKAKAFLPKLDEWRKNELEMLTDSYEGKIGKQEADKYLMQRWKFKGDEEYRNKFNTLGRKIMNDPYMKERKIHGYKEGIEELGMEPAYRDVADIILERHRTAVQSIANQKMAKTLKDIGAIVNADQAKKAGVLHNWPQAVDSHALYRAAYSGKKTRTSEGPLGEINKVETIYRKDKPVFVNPDMKMAVDAIFADSRNSMMPAVIENLRSASKQDAVLFSQFHAYAMTDQAQSIALGHNRPGKAIASTFFVNKEYWKGMASGVWKVAGKETPYSPEVLTMAPELIEPWLKTGLDMSTSDQESRLALALKNVDIKGKGILGSALTKGAHALGAATEVSNTALFDYYVPGQMIGSAETIFTREIQKLGPNASPQQIDLLRRNISGHVNRAFGTESMERMLLHPKVRGGMAFLLFAPAWTLSNIRLLSTGYESETQKRLRNKWVRGAAATWFISTEIFNYALSSWYGGYDKNGKFHEPRNIKSGWFSWDNPGATLRLMGKEIPGITENMPNVYAGANPDGSQRYIRLSKGQREVFGWIQNPIQTFGGKLGLFAKQLFVQIGGVEPGSGYQVINKNATLKEQVVQRGAEAATLFSPFVADQLRKTIERTLIPEVTPESGTGSMLGGLPVSKGITLSRAAEAYKIAVEEKRPDLARQVLKVASINKIDPDRVVAAYKSEVTKRKKTARGPKVHYDTSGRVAPPR